MIASNLRQIKYWQRTISHGMKCYGSLFALTPLPTSLPHVLLILTQRTQLGDISRLPVDSISETRCWLETLKERRWRIGRRFERQGAQTGMRRPRGRRCPSSLHVRLGGTSSRACGAAQLCSVSPKRCDSSVHNGGQRRYITAQ